MLVTCASANCEPGIHPGRDRRLRDPARGEPPSPRQQRTTRPEGGLWRQAATATTSCLKRARCTTGLGTERVERCPCHGTQHCLAVRHIRSTPGKRCRPETADQTMLPEVIRRTSGANLIWQSLAEQGRRARHSSAIRRSNRQTERWRTSSRPRTRHLYFQP